MFDPSSNPRVFCTPLGVDFSAELIAGLDERLRDAPPHALAQVEIFIASDRMRRRIEALYAKRSASFLPRLTPVGRLADRPELSDLPPPLSPLGLRLRLVTLISALLEQDARLAPRSALYDLADSLATLMAEMHEETVSPQAIAALQTEELAQHWGRNAAFLNIIARYFGDVDGPIPVEARQALAVDRLAAHWAHTPPQTPVIVAGSTGSRGATARLMAAVAKLPQGAVILPGLDPHMPDDVWRDLMAGRRGEGLAGEDHPQFRLGRFAEVMGFAPKDIPTWTDKAPVAPDRSAWVSLALRPAPVTDSWLYEAPKLPAPAHAFEDVTMLEAASPREEAAAIALRLREAAETGQTATLVTPDRTLARAVTVALDRWGILPDDSAGLPLDMTNPGRLLALAADLMAGRGDAVELLAVLKHPLTHAGSGREQHLRWIETLELKVLRGGGLHPTRADLNHWTKEHGGDADWATWVAETILDAREDPAPLEDLVARHIALTEALADGPAPKQPGELWEGDAGQAAFEKMRAVAAEAGESGVMRPRDYRDLITSILADTELRNPARPHAGVMIWGALEARVQGADLMILGGLNEGVWPSGDVADPWLNRTLRAQAGLRLPDRRTGLSAHDFQQAVGAPEVWLSRAARDAETETVPSRWLNRLTNLMQGSGKPAQDTLKAMRARGDRYLSMAQALETPAQVVPRAARTAPAPPRAVRPRQLSVTQIEKLVRDPFAIYAQKVLGLTPLEPLRPEPDARLKGTILHAILRRFVEATKDGLPEAAEAQLLAMAEDELRLAGDWPVARHLWMAALARGARAFVEGEAQRRAYAAPEMFEIKGEAEFAPLGVRLRGTADRIDRLPDGRLAIYDYKTGALPTEKVERMFNQQLRLEAAMAARGAFGTIEETARVAYLGLDGAERCVDLTPDRVAETADRLTALWARFLEETHGFTPRRAMQSVSYDSDYQHLARFGEWDDADAAVVVRVGA